MKKGENKKKMYCLWWGKESRRYFIYVDEEVLKQELDPESLKRTEEESEDIQPKKKKKEKN